MIAVERYKKIMELIEKSGSVKSTDLVDILGVSSETVRRDLDFLSEQKSIKKVYGGAVKQEEIDGKSFFKKRKFREKECIDEKVEIAEIAVHYIKEGQTIAMNASTTTYELAKKIKDRFNNLTIVTNSMLIANEFSDADDFTIILSGGILSKDELSVVGEISAATIEKFTFDTAFISVSGVSSIFGITDYSFDEYKIQKSMIKSSNKSIFLADSSKFNCNHLLKVCKLDESKTIITDSKLPTEVLNEYKDLSINIVNSI